MATLFESLISNAVTASVLAVVVFAVGRFFRHQVIIHGLWVLVLLKLVTPSVVSLPFSIPVDNSWLTFSTQQMFGNAGQTASTEEGRAHDGSGLNAHSGISGGGSAAGVTPLSGETDLSALRKPGGSSFRQDSVMSLTHVAVSALLLIWMAGSGVYIIRLLFRYVRFCRFLRNNLQVDEGLISEGYDLAYKMGLKRPPRVRVLSGAFSPMLCGLGRGLTLILPLDLLHRLAPEGRATLVVHELAHYARGDYLVRVLETMVTAVYWWHPVVWWVRRELETVEEDCCDSRVIAEFPGQPRHYAEAILDAIDFLCERPVAMPPVSSGLGSAPMLKRRLTRIMTEAPAPDSPRWGRMGVMASAVLALPMQVIHFRPEPAVAAESAVASADLLAATHAAVQAADQLSEEQFAAVSSSQVWSRVRSPDGRWTLLADDHQRCRLVSLSERRSIELPASIVSCVVFSPNSKMLAAGMTDGRVLLFRAPGWVVPENAGLGSAIRSIDWSPAGDRLALCTEAGDITVLTVDGLHCTASRRLPMAFLNCVRFTPDANQLVVGCGDWKTEDDSSLLLIDSSTLRLTRVLPSEFPVALVRFGEHDNEMTSCHWSGRATLWTLPEMNVLSTQWIPKDQIAPLAFSAQADEDGVISGAF